MALLLKQLVCLDINVTVNAAHTTVYEITSVREPRGYKLNCFHDNNRSPNVSLRGQISQYTLHSSLNTLRPRQNGRHFADDIFKCIFLNENVWIPIEISLKGQINNIPSIFLDGAKPLSEPMMVSLLTQICVTRPQWVNSKIESCVPLSWVYFREYMIYWTTM